MRCCCSPVLPSFRPLTSSPTQVQLPGPERQCHKFTAEAAKRSITAFTTELHPCRQKMRLLSLPLTKQALLQVKACCGLPILPHHHFQQILIPLHPEHSDGSLCSSLELLLEMHLASLIQQPSFKRGAFPASFHNSKGFPNTPSPACHMWFLYFLLSPALPSSP